MISGSDVPPHPREVLHDMASKAIEERHINQAELARLLGISRARFNMIMSGRCRLSPEVALRIERVLGVPAEFWMRLAAEYDLFQTRRRLREDLAALQPLDVQAVAA